MFKWNDRKAIVGCFVSILFEFDHIYVSNELRLFIAQRLTDNPFFIFSDYNEYSVDGILANIYGVCIVVFGSLVAYAGTNSSYRRLVKPEEGLLLESGNQD